MSLDAQGEFSFQEPDGTATTKATVTADTVMEA